MGSSKEAKHICLYAFRTDESLGFLLEAKEIASNITVEADEPFVTAFENSLEEFEAVTKMDQKNSFTPMLNEAEKKLVRVWSGMKSFIEGQKKFPDSNISEIAARALDVLEKYGNFVELSQMEISANSKGLSDELRLISSSDLETIGLTVWLNALDSAHNDFMVCMVAKAKEGGSREKGVVQQRRKEAEDAYYTLIDRVNNGAGYNGVEPYKVFINTINAEIDQMKTILAARETRAKHSKNDDTDLPTDPDLPA